MSNDRLEAARAEAGRRYRGRSPEHPMTAVKRRTAFMAGVRWADDSPQPHTVTRERWEYACDGAFSDLRVRLGRERFDWFAEALGIEVVEDER